MTAGTIRHSGGHLPSQQQLLLLRAAVLRGPQAVEAWRRWSSQVDIEAIDYGSYRLLPKLYRNLQALDVDDPNMERLKSVYRHTWYKNRTMLHGVAPVLCELQAAGIPTLVLKGAALVALYYKDYGVRPMEDLDILVPAHDAMKAMTLLHDMSWTSAVSSPERLVPVKNAVGFRDAGGRQIDLHWHVLKECCEIGADDEFWAHAVPLDIGGVATYALSPTDQLLHIFVHGVAWNSVPPFRWAADAVSVLDAAGESIDWGRLVSSAQRRQVVLPVRYALRILRTRLGAQVPDSVLDELQRAPVSRIERMEYRTKMRPPGPLGELPFYLSRYLRLAESGRFGRGPLGFGHYLQYVWRLDHSRQVPMQLLKVGVRRLRNSALDGWRQLAP